jgi:hypothetical protein
MCPYLNIFKVHLEIQQSQDEIASIPKKPQQLNNVDAAKKDITALLMRYSKKNIVSREGMMAHEHTRRFLFLNLSK